MGKHLGKQKNKSAKGRSAREMRSRKKRQSASIYFLLWTIFAVFALVIVLLFGFSQQAMLRRAYKDEAAQEIAEKGEKIRFSVLSGPPGAFGVNNYNGYIRFLATTYSVNIAILDEEGNLLFPIDPNFDREDPEYKGHYDYSEELISLKAHLAENGTSKVVYEGEEEYVYGAEIRFLGDTEMYLYVGKSLQLMHSAMTNMSTRTILLAVFVVILTFALSSAVAGWVVTPITEMTKKAHQLAQGDFGVDFHSGDYGSEMIQLADSLNLARDELSKTDRMQKELIANVSHDFKTPLTMIKGYASMIKEISGNNPEKRNKHAQIIVDEADRLASLVNDVLDLSKISAGIAQLDVKKIDVSTYLKEILERFDYLSDSQGYTFVTDIEEGLVTQADEGKIGQALYNLIGNAVNYTGEDKMVYISLKKENEESFRFSVRDTGVGIKPEEIGEIWDRYYRSTESHKRPVQGTGLGLSIVKTVLTRHGFRFGVESEVGEGSTFYVLFPIAKNS